MRIPLKYGLLVAAVFIAWIVIVKLIMNVRTDATVNLIGPVLYNIAAIIGILLGMRERKNELHGQLSFKQALKTGMGICLVYAVTASLFFVVQWLISGPALLLSESGPSPGPLWQVALGAFAGLFLGSLFFGLIYSTIIGFFLARRLSQAT